ncbi:AAHS family 4-hydroxybenzoate transporter-like MFS transporter [Paraburkholderia sp. BL23I1N1]|uniref:MFS transporter n=1 Tax=Paraburkholderia sp. BL23I1N1 TaxID=1938802 RepID=UPI000E745794|nr:MFS transporter [Paraburkholderia sp. BL23I1N1]RKE36358.1 AAHS family 4-hydroxybenzoate transporter-like MFS transporter [Paraburkholderia sp. BL23I1N1]
MALPAGEPVASVFDSRPIGFLQWVALAICGMCMVIDGFDVQAMAYAAPALIRAWGVDRSVLGPVFSAGLLGMFVGSLALAGLADRFGRRPMLIAATLWVALWMVLTPFSATINQLIGIRFGAGVGMGVIIPNAMALASEYSQARVRMTLMMIVSSGYVVGGVVGGAVAGLVIGPYGWGGVFYAGALLTALLGFTMVFVLPESLQYYLLHQPGKPRTWQLLQRLAPGAAMPGEAVASHIDERRTRHEQRTRTALFGDGRTMVTPLLWAANFGNMLCAYFLAAWIPVLMSKSVGSAEGAVMAGTILWIGGLAGNALLGTLIDRWGFAAVLLINFVVGGLAIAGISLFHAAPHAAMLFVALAGFCVLGGQSGLNALAVTLYPTQSRATGAGWALGVGRLGAVLGPLAGGHLMAIAWTADQTLLVSAIPAACAAAAIGALGLLFRRRIEARSVCVPCTGDQQDQSGLPDGAA